MARIDKSEYRKSILAAILTAMHRHGGKHVIASDITPADMNYRQLFLRSFILGGKLKPIIGDQKYVAIMLPNSLGAVATFVSLHLLGRIPCMLNFSAGEANMLHACRIAGVRTVLTSRIFIEKAKLEHVADALGKDHRIVWLEDIRKIITPVDKIKGVLKSLFPKVPRTSPGDPAVILYTSGSEGVPKGVALSHSNILANIQQACVGLDLNSRDTVFNAMPVFHSFGLVVGMLMPLVRGIRTYMYPSPVHYRIIPGEVEKSRATILLGTDTFYNGWAKYSELHQYKNIRLAVAGAEKLKDSTRRFWLDNYGVDILQGYGITETSPVLSVNTPSQHKPGTVGRPLDLVDVRLQPVEGLSVGGRLEVRGPNIMLGYLKADKPGIINPQGEWYDSGDIVDIDAQGYITILGRAKRFAKIAGEMVSLQVVEELAAGVLPDVGHAALAIPDDAKGEQIVLYTEGELSKEALIQHAQEKGIAKICLPKQIIHLKEIPRLGNGKIDYMSLRKLAG